MKCITLIWDSILLQLAADQIVEGDMEPRLLLKGLFLLRVSKEYHWPRGVRKRHVELKTVSGPAPWIRNQEVVVLFLAQPCIDYGYLQEAGTPWQAKHSVSVGSALPNDHDLEASAVFLNFFFFVLFHMLGIRTESMWAGGDIFLWTLYCLQSVWCLAMGTSCLPPCVNAFSSAV